MITDEQLDTFIAEYGELDRKNGLVLYDSPILRALKELKLRRQVMNKKVKQR